MPLLTSNKENKEIKLFEFGLNALMVIGLLGAILDPRPENKLIFAAFLIGGAGIKGAPNSLNALHRIWGRYSE